MLKLDKCQIIESRTAPVASTVSMIHEGLFLVSAMENGKAVMMGSTGVAGEKFMGVSVAKHLRPSSAVSSVTTTVPSAAPEEVTLPATPTEIGVVIDGVPASVGAGAGNYQLSGATLTFDAGDQSKTVEILYRYELTVAQSNMLFGGDSIATDISNVDITMITTGLVYTDQYALTDDWTDTSADIKLAADGKITNDAGAAGTVLDAIVEELPSSAGGFIGIRIKP